VTAPAPEPGTVSAASTNTAISPALTVSGIAFQDGSNDNMAIINGIAVSRGATVEGVRVEDIQKDRVRFSHSGEKFEVLLNKSNR
jgi:general secretion pathway protein B